jgi:hypothetical protein
VIPQPYIGITGFVSAADILCAAECAETVRTVVPSHRLMAGVLVSWRGLAGIQHTSRRYPRIETVDGILRKLLHAGCWPVVHYNTSNHAYPVATPRRARASVPGQRVGSWVPGRSSRGLP